MTKLQYKHLSYLGAAVCIILLSMKVFFMYPGNYSRSDLREYRKQYRDIFEYDLTTESNQYWSKVVTNYKELNPTRQKILQDKLSSGDQKKLKESIYYINKILKNRTYLVPQRVKDNIIFLSNKNVFEYLYELQAPVLEKGI